MGVFKKAMGEEEDGKEDEIRDFWVYIRDRMHVKRVIRVAFLILRSWKAQELSHGHRNARASGTVARSIHNLCPAQDVMRGYSTIFKGTG